MEVQGLKPDGTISKGKTVHDLCHPCDTENQLAPAVGLCHDCQHKLCQRCYDGHLIPLLTRKHRLSLLASAATANTTPSTGASTETRGTLTCAKHADKVVEFYCTKHDVAVCATCIYKRHKTCEKENLSEIPDDFSQSKEYSNLSNTLGEYGKTIDLIHNYASTNITDAEKSNDAALQELQMVKKKIIEHFNKIEKDLIKSGKKMKTEDANSLKTVQTECQTMKSDLVQQQSELQSHEQNNVDLYVISRHAFKLIEKLHAKIESISKQNQSFSYRFQPDDFIQTITTVKRLGTIERTSTPTNVPVPVPIHPPKSIQLKQEVSTSTPPLSKPVQQKKYASEPAATSETQSDQNPGGHSYSESFTKCSSSLASAKITQVEDITVKRRKDKETCFITGVTLLSPGRLLVADTDNNAVKCLDTTSNTVTSNLKLPSKPWDVTVLPGDQAAVTLPYKGQIQILSTVRSLSPIRTIKVKGKCHGITSTKDKMIFSYVGKDTRVDIMNIQGGVLYTIQYDQRGKPLFSHPWYVAVSGEAGSEAIYVSDCNTHKVIKLSMCGQVLLTYTDKELMNPLGLTVTNDGHLLVCSASTDQVHLVSRHGEKIKTLISGTGRLISPQTVCECRVENKIFVSTSATFQNSLKIYKIN